MKDWQGGREGSFLIHFDKLDRSKKLDLTVFILNEIVGVF
jgi:hypothetical protein